MQGGRRSGDRRSGSIAIARITITCAGYKRISEIIMRILVAVDGSPIAVRAARYAARLALALKEKPQVVLLSVDAPLLRAVAVELGVHGVEKYHAENGAFAIKAAKSAMNRLDVQYEVQLLVGDAAQSIVKCAKSGKYDLVVMGSHGRNAFKSLFLGSVSAKVLAHSEVPVTIVR
jgi:nucleotide-binding universal stress UspA family protein